ncbi:MAG: MBL fold metallo-hydrolase [Halioglobus sp.]
MITTARFEDLGDGITCIDAGYIDHGIACFYLVQSGNDYAVIETGTNHSVPLLQQCLQQRGIAPRQIRYVMPTHVHLDHAGGAGAMMAVFPEAQLVVHPRGERHMVDPQRLVAASIAVYGERTFRQLYGEIQAVNPDRVLATADGDCVQLGSRELQFRFTEGHARHHHCIWDEQSAGWFTGDMFGVCYPWFRFPEGDFVLPSTTPTQFDPDAYLASLALLASYSPRRMYLTHYGAIAFTDEKRELLASQVKQYAALAADSTVSSQEMPATLLDYALARLQAHTPSSAQGDLKRWLQQDIPLNTQGLLHWRESAEQTG